MKLKLTQKQDLKTFFGIALTFASLVALLSLVGCAPKTEKRVYPVAKTDFGPTQKDTDLGLDKLTVEEKAVVSADKLKWSGVTETADLFRFAETVSTLGSIEQSDSLKALGRKLGRSFYAADGTSTKNAFEDSLYVLAAAGETKTDSLKTIKETDEMLAREHRKIDQILLSLQKRTEWPTETASTHEMLEAAEAFGARFLRHLKREDVEPQIRDAVADAFEKDFYPLIRSLDREIGSILSEQRSVNVIRRLREFMTKNEFKLSPETDAQLTKAEAVMLHIEAIEKRHDALTVIIELWEMTAPENREATFKPVSEDLFGYLKNKGPKSLNCVKSRKCLNPIIWIPKEVAILPAIEKYGVEKIKADISVAAHEALIEQIKTEIAAVVPTVPAEIGMRIGTEISGIRTKLASVQADYDSFLKSIATEYAKDDLTPSSSQNSRNGGKNSIASNSSVQLSGLESQKVAVSLAKGELKIKPEAVMNGVSTGSEVIGAAMAFAAANFESEAQADPIAFKKSLLSQINKMLAVGGFKNAEGKRFKSLSLSIDPKAKQRHFYIRDFIGSESGFAVPDQMLVTSKMMTPETTEGGMNIGIRAQGELLRGFSGMVRYLRDWEKNSFDETLGKVEIGRLIKDLPAQSLDEKLFPKEMFFSIAVGNAAAILQNMTKKLSPVFLIDLNNQTSWSNERDTEGDTPATMAAVVDIKMGKRTELVKTADAARFLLSIVDFLDATEGIENTKSGPLVEPDSEGKTAIDQIVDAKRDLKLLIVGIANFLSHKMADDDGGVRASFSQTLVSIKAGEARTLSDQAVTILALERASAVLGKDVYAWAAMDVFAFMNKTLWNPKTGFYRAQEGKDESPSLAVLTETLLAGERLKSRLPEKGQTQWQLISQPWLRALEQL